jgi:hypothetical protein
MLRERSDRRISWFQQAEIFRGAQDDKKTILHEARLSALLYENSLVERASVQWGGRPRPPTDMAARDGHPTDISHVFMFHWVRKEMLFGMRTF